MTDLTLFKNILGNLLIFTSIFDAAKYSVQAFKIHRDKKARMSRRFINWAISNDVVKLLYGFAIIDVYIILSSLLALFCMFHLWAEIYWWYPYRMRGCHGFKRPNIMLYLVNSILPNQIRKRL